MAHGNENTEFPERELHTRSESIHWPLSCLDDKLSLSVSRGSLERSSSGIMGFINFKLIEPGNYIYNYLTLEHCAALKFDESEKNKRKIKFIKHSTNRTEYKADSKEKG